MVNPPFHFLQGKSLETSVIPLFEPYPTSVSPSDPAFEMYLQYDHFSHPPWLPYWSSHYDLSSKFWKYLPN
jgi:hypothetical protein